MSSPCPDGSRALPAVCPGHEPREGACSAQDIRHRHGALRPHVQPPQRPELCVVQDTAAALEEGDSMDFVHLMGDALPFETSGWNLSRRVAPQNVYYDEHYLCTVAAGGHRKIVKPLRLGADLRQQYPYESLQEHSDPLPWRCPERHSGESADFDLSPMYCTAIL